MYGGLGERIRAERKRRRWTQNDLQQAVRKVTGAERLSRTTLSEIENGRYDSEPGMWLIEALATAFDTTADYLIGLSDDPGAPELPRFPVPAIEIVPLVARLNDLSADDRRQLAKIFMLIVEAANPASGEDAELAQLHRVWRNLAPARRDRLVAELLTEIAEAARAKTSATKTAVAQETTV